MKCRKPPALTNDSAAYSLSTSSSCISRQGRGASLNASAVWPSALRTRPLALDHVADQLRDGRVAAHAHVPVVVGVHPVLQAPLRGELVEVRARDRDVDARVARGVLVDLRPGNLHAPDWHIAAGAQLEPDYELQLPQSRHLVLEVLHGLLDQGLGIATRHASKPRSCCAPAASCRSPCAGSRRCPRRSGAAGRRGRGARSRTPSSSRSRRGCGTPPQRPPCPSRRRTASPCRPPDPSAAPRPSCARPSA